MTDGVPSLLSMDIKPAYDQGDSEEFFVRVRGLPFSTTPSEILEFFSDVNILGGVSGITFTFTRDGRPSGEAYISVTTHDDQLQALEHNKEHIGSRYIEVFEANREEMEYVVGKSGPNPTQSNEGVLRLRGLPFGCSKEEIVQFFSGYEIVPNGITMRTDHNGRTSGDAYVQFVSQSVAERAITDKHTKRIGHRYIELFRSTMMEAQQGAGGGGGGGYGGPAGGPPGGGGRRPMRPAPYERPDRYGGGGGYGGGRGGYSDPYAAPRDRYGGGGASGGRFKDFGGGHGGGMRGGRGGRGGGGRGGGRGGGSASNNGADHISSTGHSVHMRGLPFSASNQDIARFFAPLRPVEIVIGVNDDGRKSGEADVDFATHEDACDSMKKDKSNMEHRYIELFLNSTSMGNGRGGGGGYGGGRDYASNNYESDFGGPPAPAQRFGGGMPHGGGGRGGGRGGYSNGGGGGGNSGGGYGFGGGNTYF